MKVICVIILSLVSQLTYGQAFETLDDTGNFYDFEFGSSAESYGNDITLDLTISYGTKYYKYRGKFKKFEDFKIHDMNLGFQDDKLEYLDLYFKKLDDEAYEQLLSTLEAKYGSATSFTALDKGVDSAKEWKGERLTMQLYSYNDQAIDYDDRNMTVLILQLNH